MIRLPEGKDVVVDSKVTLVAYEQALASEDEQARQLFLKQHVDAVKGQIKKLADQDYDQLPDLRSLDFVLLFIPIESAFTLAMELDSRLFIEAFNKRIMLVSPTTLMMALRIIDNLWQVEKQNRNAQDIAQRAGALYDKLQGVVEEVDKLGRQLGTVQGTYDTLYGRLAGRSWQLGGAGRKTSGTGRAGEEGYCTAFGRQRGRRSLRQTRVRIRSRPSLCRLTVDGRANAQRKPAPGRKRQGRLD